jgi:hypothetical protein
MPPRLAWLAGNVVNGTRSGIAAQTLLDEMRGMSNVRWRMGTVTAADSVDAVRDTLHAMAAPPAPVEAPPMATFLLDMPEDVPPAVEAVEAVEAAPVEAKPAKPAKAAKKATTAQAKEAPHAD